MNFQFNSAMKKVSIGFGVALAFLLVIALLLFDIGSGVFWISALFLFFAYIAIYGTVMFYLSDKDNTIRQYPANYPLIHIAIVYSIAQVILVAILCILNAILKNGLNMRYWLAFELILLLVFGVRYAIFNSARKYSVGLEQKTQAKVTNIRMLTDKCMRIQQSVQELPEELRADAGRAVRTMEEKVRYADPMSHESLQPMDYDIERGIDIVAAEVERLLADGSRDIETLRRKVRDVNNLVDSRNNRVRMMK